MSSPSPQRPASPDLICDKQSLAAWLQVSRETLRKWLLKIKDAIKLDTGRRKVLNQFEVKAILTYLETHPLCLGV